MHASDIVYKVFNNARTTFVVSDTYFYKVPGCTGFLLFFRGSSLITTTSKNRPISISHKSVNMELGTLTHAARATLCGRAHAARGP